MADSMGAELMIVHAVTQNEQVLGNADESEALELLFRLANDYGAEMQMIRCENALDGLADTAQKNDVGLMILGASPQSAQSLSEKIRARLPYMSFIVLGANTWVDQIA